MSFQPVAAPAFVQAKVPHGRPAIAAKTFVLPDAAVQLPASRPSPGKCAADADDADAAASVALGTDAPPRATYAGAGAYF